MKYFIAVVFALSLMACKKTEKLKPEVLPDTYVDPTYLGKLESNLNIGVGSNGPVDSTFTFSSNLWENVAGSTSIAFGRTSYNGKITGSVDSGVKFLDFANRSNWDLQSVHVGNFTHVNNSPTPLIGNVVGLVPATFSGNALMLNLQNISNADKVVVTSYDGGISLGGITETFMVDGKQTLPISVTTNVSFQPLNTDLRITVGLWKSEKINRNGSEIEVIKITNYIYKTKKTS